MTAQREWLEKDYYKVLGVDQNAPQKDIAKKYKVLARKSHPDTNPDDASAEERFKEISAAYDVLGDEAKRAEYDEMRRLGPMAGAFRGGAPPGSGGSGFRFDAEDLGGLFGNLFSGGGRGGGGRTGPGRGADLETDLHLSFREAASGLTTSVGITSEVACSTCAGTGARPGTSSTQCPTCGGRGITDDNQGFFSFSKPCTTCAGRGLLVTDPCASCNGAGTEIRPRNVKVRIPPGVSDSQRIRLKGRGAPGRNGGPAGDLFVRVHVAVDDTFGRKGNDLTLTVPITFPEAALGAKITVPTLSGDPVTLKIPAGTASGRTFRVKGAGIPAARGSGNLLVTVDIVVPDKLTKEAKRAVEALADATSESPRDYLGL